MYKHADNKKAESYPWYRIWNIDSVLFVCVVCCLLFVVVFISNFRKIIRILQVISVSPFPRFTNFLHFMESFENKLETFCSFTPKHISVYFKDIVLHSLVSF